MAIEREHPTYVAGIDWRNLQKGDVIPADRIDDAYAILKPDAKATDASWRSLFVKGWLEQRRNEIDKPLVFKQVGGDLQVLTDAQAVTYLDGQANSGLRKHRNSTRRMYTSIDEENLSNFDRDQLGTNKAKHGMIMAAAQGAKKEASRMIRNGIQLPKLPPPDM